MEPIYILIDNLKYFALHHKWPSQLLPLRLKIGKTVYQIYQTLTEEQKYMINAIIGSIAQEYDDEIQKIKKEHK